MENERVIYSACPLCASARIADLRSASCVDAPAYNEALSDTIRWKRCDDCQHIFTEGYFTDEALKVLFQKTEANQIAGADLERNRVVSARMIEKVLPFQDSGLWVDVGFGNGALLMTADEYGFDTIGLDLRESSVIPMKLLGFDCRVSDICDLALDREAAVISMADVLEHTPFPAKCLRAAHRLLGRGGALFLSMPNADAFAWRMSDMQRRNPYWGEIEHYHNFGRRRLYELLEETGFEPRRYGISERYRMCMEVVAIKA